MASLTESQKVGCCMEWPCYRQSQCGDYTKSSHGCDLFMKDYCLAHRGPATTGSWPQECECLAATLQYVAQGNGHYFPDPSPSNPHSGELETISEFTYSKASDSMKDQWPHHASPGWDPYCGIDNCSRSHISYIPYEHRYTQTGCPSKVCYQMETVVGHDNKILSKIHEGSACGGPGTPTRSNTFGNPPAPSKEEFYTQDFIKFLKTFWPILMILGVLIFAAEWYLFPVKGGTSFTSDVSHTNMH